MENPLVSVIIPIYNAQVYIEETILSVLNQTYEHFELLLVNHNSTDKSILFIEQYRQKDKRVKVLHLDINKGGPAYPRNEGLKVAKGEYVAFVDSDDVWLTNKLEKQLSYIKSNNADIVHSLANIIDKKSDISGLFNNQKFFNILKYIMSIKNIIFYTNYININSVLMKNNSKLRFNEDNNLVALEDWNFWIESLRNDKKIILQKEVLLNYRVHDSSISNRKNDSGYRKTLYLLSLLLVKEDIPLKHYIFSSLFNLFKIFMKNSR